MGWISKRIVKIAVACLSLYVLNASYVPSEPSKDETFTEAVYRAASDCSLRNMNLPSIQIGKFNAQDITLPDISLADGFDYVNGAYSNIKNACIGTYNWVADLKFFPSMEPYTCALGKNESEPAEEAEEPSDMEVSVDGETIKETADSIASSLPKVDIKLNELENTRVTLKDGTVITPQSVIGWYIGICDEFYYDYVHQDMKPLVEEWVGSTSSSDYIE